LGYARGKPRLWTGESQSYAESRECAQRISGIGFQPVIGPVIGPGPISLAPALAKLASPQSEGGAAITFSPTAPGSARISINAENEISFTIADAAGRTVMTGILHPADSATPNELITWDCSLHVTTLDQRTLSCQETTNRCGWSNHPFN
jgi:hypothetical protein